MVCSDYIEDHRKIHTRQPLFWRYDVDLLAGLAGDLNPVDLVPALV